MPQAFYKLEMEWLLLNLVYDANIDLMPKRDNKGNSRPMYLMNIDAKILAKYKPNLIIH